MLQRWPLPSQKYSLSPKLLMTQSIGYAPCGVCTFTASGPTSSVPPCHWRRASMISPGASRIIAIDWLASACSARSSTHWATSVVHGSIWSKRSLPTRPLIVHKPPRDFAMSFASKMMGRLRRASSWQVFYGSKGFRIRRFGWQKAAWPRRKQSTTQARNVSRSPWDRAQYRCGREISTLPRTTPDYSSIFLTDMVFRIGLTTEPCIEG